MTRALLFAALLPLLRAQSPPAVAITTPQPDGSVILTIQNRSNSALTAYFWQGTHERHYFDAALTLGPQPIPPHQQSSWPLYMGGQVTLVAALFADGSTYGDAQTVSHLRARRDLAQTHIENAMNVLQQAVDSRMETPALIQQLTTILAGLSPPAVNREDAPVVRRYYETPLQLLSNPGRKTPDRQFLQSNLRELERERERLQLYR